MNCKQIPETPFIMWLLEMALVGFSCPFCWFWKVLQWVMFLSNCSPTKLPSLLGWMLVKLKCEISCICNSLIWGKFEFSLWLWHLHLAMPCPRGICSCLFFILLSNSAHVITRIYSANFFPCQAASNPVACPIQNNCGFGCYGIIFLNDFPQRASATSSTMPVEIKSERL